MLDSRKLHRQKMVRRASSLLMVRRVSDEMRGGRGSRRAGSRAQKESAPLKQNEGIEAVDAMHLSTIAWAIAGKRVRWSLRLQRLQGK